MQKIIFIFTAVIGLLPLFAGISIAEELSGIPSDEKLLPLSDNPRVCANVDWPDKDIIEAKQITDTVKHQVEIDRACDWFTEIIRPEYLPEGVKNKVILMPQMKYGDDWIMVRYCFNGYKIQIIDGRALTIIVKPLSTPNQKIPIPDYVTSIFKDIFGYDSYEKGKVNVETKEIKADGENSYGKLSWNKKWDVWLKNDTFTWWSNGDSIIFDIQKIAIPRFAKGLPSRDTDHQIVNGIPYGDKRKFIRFNAENKIYLDEEFKRYYKPKETVGHNSSHGEPDKSDMLTPKKNGSQKPPNNQNKDK